MTYELNDTEKRALLESVVERARADLNDGRPLTEMRGRQTKCNCFYHRLPEAQRTALIDRAVELTNAEVIATGGYLPLTFDDDWELAPLSMTKTTERECALWWYECGRRAERARLLAEQNVDLAEMCRLAQERLR